MLLECICRRRAIAARQRAQRCSSRCPVAAGKLPSGMCACVPAGPPRHDTPAFDSGLTPLCSTCTPAPPREDEGMRRRSRGASTHTRTHQLVQLSRAQLQVEPKPLPPCEAAGSD